MIAGVASAWMWLWVVLYAAYTPGGVVALRPLMTGPRRLAFWVGFAGLAIGLVIDVETAWVWVAVGSMAAAYARWRQWLVPRAALKLTTSAETCTGRVVVLPDGRGVPVAVLQRARVAQVDGWSVVHCAVSGSVAVFEATGLRAVLPHPTGFEVGSADGAWDGVDGSGTGEGLRRLPVALVAGFSGELLAGPGRLPEERVVRPVVSGARGLAEPLERGRVVAGAWHPEADGGEPRDGYLLGRWAAMARGLV